LIVPVTGSDGLAQKIIVSPKKSGT